jgi:hypothetical protein
MNRKEVHAFACKAGSEELGFGLVTERLGYGFPSATSLPQILVNRNGNRFMNEYFYTGHNRQTKEFDAYEMKFLSPDGVNFCDWPNIPYYAIFDSVAMKSGPLVPQQLIHNGAANGRYYANVHDLYNWSSDNSVELAKGWIVTADTPQDLGAKITCRDFFGAVVGMNANGLAATVTAYNAACAAGVDNAFGRPKNTLLPLSNPPYYAMEVVECQTRTDGGPVHDAQARTLDVNDNPIPRLYSAGELGSAWGFLYGGGFGEAIGMGHLAGVNAAALPSWT